MSFLQNLHHKYQVYKELVIRITVIINALLLIVIIATVLNTHQELSGSIQVIIALLALVLSGLRIPGISVPEFINGVSQRVVAQVLLYMSTVLLLVIFFWAFARESLPQLPVPRSEICDTTRTKAVITAREYPGLDKPSPYSVDANTNVEMICNTGTIQNGMKWIRIKPLDKGKEAWVPLQDIMFEERLCNRARTDKQVLVRNTPGTNTDVIYTIPQGYEVYMFCNAREIKNGITWSKIILKSLSGKTISGWLPDSDISLR